MQSYFWRHGTSLGVAAERRERVGPVTEVRATEVRATQVPLSEAADAESAIRQDQAWGAAQSTSPSPSPTGRTESLTHSSTER